MFLVNSYGLNGKGRDAVELFCLIPRPMIAAKTYVCVLNACSHSGLVDKAREIFSGIPVKSKWHYTAMVKNSIY
jgi:pentatricopeptide repeat protein